MNKKLGIIIIAVLVNGINGCDKRADVAANSASSSTVTKVLEKIAVKPEPIKGYKSFQFGMSNEALSKIPGCSVPEPKTNEEQLVDAMRGQGISVPIMTCSIEFMGSPTKVTPVMINNQLKGINIDLGVYEEDRFASLAKALAEKYPVKLTITEDQRTAFNSDAIDQVAMVYAEGQVGLFIYKEKGTNFHDGLGLTLDQSMQLATPTVTQKILLQYVDIDQSKLMIEAASKGKTKSGDL